MQRISVNLIYLLSLLPLAAAAEEFTSEQICGDVEITRCTAIVGRLAELLASTSPVTARPEFEIKEAEPDKTFGDFAKIKFGFGFTNSTASIVDSDGTDIGRNIDDETVRKVSLGIFEYPLKQGVSWLDNNWGKNLLVSAYYSYGTTTTDKIENDLAASTSVLTDNVENKSSYFVGLKYELSLKDMSGK